MTTSGCQQFPDKAIIYAVLQNIKRYSIFSDDSSEIGNNHAVSLFDRKNRLGLNEINSLGLIKNEELIISDRVQGIFSVDLLRDGDMRTKKVFNFSKTVDDMSVDEWTGNVYGALKENRYELGPSVKNKGEIGKGQNSLNTKISNFLTFLTFFCLFSHFFCSRSITLRSKLRK